VKITAVQRGPDAADRHLLPTFCFRHNWSDWIAESIRAPRTTPRADRRPAGVNAVAAAQQVRQYGSRHMEARPSTRDR
jgi:hypothetical protein